MWMDSHQHFWRLGDSDCAWPTPDLTAIYRDFGPLDLKALAAQSGITGSVLVQSQPSDRDTDFLCELAEHDAFIKAIVAWVDLKSPAAQARIETLASRKKVRGVRPMLQSLPPEWITDAALDPAIAALKRCGLSFDALVRPEHLPHLMTFARRHADLPIVIDHAAKPNIRDRLLQPWADHIQALAAMPNVYCKLSGLLTEAKSGDGDKELAPYVDHIFANFGAERIMWGSDWPVLNLAGGYAAWMEQAARLADAKSGEAKRLLFSDVARHFYRVGKTP